MLERVARHPSLASSKSLYDPRQRSCVNAICVHGMCFDKETSAGVFIYSIALIGWLWSRNYPNDRFMACVSLSIALIQAVEFVMWSNPRCNAANNAATVAGALILIAQPLVALAGMAFYRNTHIPIAILQMLVLAYSICWLVYFVRLVVLAKKPRCTKASPQGYLNWDFDLTSAPSPAVSSLLWFAWLLPFFLLMAMKARTYGTTMFAVLVVTLIFSLGKGIAMERVASRSWRSLYCLLGNLLPLAALLFGSAKYGRR